VTEVSRRLRLDAPSVSFSSALLTLADRARGHGRAFLDLVDAESTLLVAMARSVVEQRKEAKNATA
jgi:hypothetical protein